MKEEKDKIIPVTDAVYKSKDIILVVGSYHFEQDGRAKYINYYISGKPYVCPFQDFHRVLASFLDDNNYKELLWKEDK